MATRTSAAEMLSYDDLYSRWEQGNWKTSEFDFSQDREDWHEKFSDLERRAALWNYAMFFHGEDSVATNLTPYIDAAPREEQKYFLTTQQVDEARHAVFFARFMSDVVDTGDSIAASLATTQPELSWGFKKVFARLDRMADELRSDRSRPKLAAAVTLYHLIVEASLAQPGQHFIEDYLGERGVLPAFYEGMQNISRDDGVSDGAMMARLRVATLSSRRCTPITCSTCRMRSRKTAASSKRKSSARASRRAVNSVSRDVSRP